jgi:hypothetical protein
MNSHEQEVFEKIYSNNDWNDAESVSGPGSTLAATRLLRQNLQEVLNTLGISSLVDAPCGDMNWMRHLTHAFKPYIGIDIVPELIAKLRADPSLKGKHFQLNNIVTDILPQSDAIFCRDCLVHLPFAMIHQAIENWRLAGFKYLMVTTFPNHSENKDCEVGQWRPLNFCAAPYHWPAPRLLISEFPEEMDWEYRDKSIGVWRLEDIPSN